MPRAVLTIAAVLAACAGVEPAVPRAALVSGGVLEITLSGGQVCRLPLPAQAPPISFHPVPDCPALGSVTVYTFEPGGRDDVLMMFQGEGPLPNDGPPLSVWIGTDRGTWRFRG
jgi:hypothetical protein